MFAFVMLLLDGYKNIATIFGFIDGKYFLF